MPMNRAASIAWTKANVGKIAYHKYDRFIGGRVVGYSSFSGKPVLETLSSHNSRFNNKHKNDGTYIWLVDDAYNGRCVEASDLKVSAHIAKTNYELRLEEIEQLDNILSIPGISQGMKELLEARIEELELTPKNAPYIKKK